VKHNSHKPSTEKQPHTPSQALNNAGQDLLRKLLDDAAFYELHALWRRKAGTASLFSGKIETADFLEANRIMQMSYQEDVVQKKFWAACDCLPKGRRKHILNLLGETSNYEEGFTAALQLLPEHERKDIEEFRRRNAEEATNEALKNPFVSLRALVRHQPVWALAQPRIANFIGRLLFVAHHGKGGPNSDAALASRLLKVLLVPERDRGKSPDLKPEYIRAYFQQELSRVRQVLGDVMPKIIRDDWKNWKQWRTVRAMHLKKPEEEVCSLSRLYELAATQHCVHYKAAYTEVEDIQRAVTGTVRIRAYAVYRTARAFGTTEKEIRKHVRDIR
jgi:hypothetical protein